jgi:hypothetical protein
MDDWAYGQMQTQIEWVKRKKRKGDTDTGRVEKWQSDKMVKWKMAQEDGLSKKWSDTEPEDKSLVYVL